MKQSFVLHFAIAFTSAAMLLASGPLAAQVTSPGNNKPLPPSAQKAPPFQQGSADLGALQAEIAALKDRVRKLEGNLTSAEVAGSYTLSLYQGGIGENAAGNATHVEHNVSAGTLQLNAGGTFAYTGRELGFSSGFGFPSTREEKDRPDGFEGTWSYSGGVLTLQIEAETIPLVGGVGGRFFVTVGANGADGSTTLILLVKNL